MTIKRCYPVLVGASVAENQLIGLSDNTRTVNGITVVRSEGTKLAYSGTSIVDLYVDAFAYTEPDSFLNNFVAGHKYLLSAKSSDNRLFLVVNKPYTDMRAGNREIIYTPSSTPTYMYCRILVSNGETISGNGRLQSIDLTVMLGSAIADYVYTLEQATAGAGVAWFRKLFPKPYYAYNAGELMSVQASSHDTVGFNQWDEEWELGYINNQTGTKGSSTTEFKSKNHIPVLPNTTYYAKTEAYTGTKRMAFYDADKNYLGASNGGWAALPNGTFTTPSGAYYMMFYVTSTTYNHDICINLSNPDRNGEYEPYTTISYPLGSDVLRGIFKLDANNKLYADGDRKEADGTITRKYGIVDLGTLNWNMYETNHFYANLPDVKIGLYAQLSNAMCSKYAQSTMSHLFDKTFAVNNGQPRINIYDSAYSDAATFKTSMDGVMLVYELATPTTEQSTPFTSPQVCYPDGTEEFVAENDVPVGHETKYQL